MLNIQKMSDLDYKYTFDIQKIIEVKELFIQRMDFINFYSEIFDDVELFKQINILSLDGITQMERLIKKDNIESIDEFNMIHGTINKINATINKELYKYLNSHKHKNN